MNSKPNPSPSWPESLQAHLRKYHFELKHVLVLFIIVVSAQLLVSSVQRESLRRFLLRTQESYKQDSSERLSNLTATALELLLTTASSREQVRSPEERQKIIEAFNIILSQQLLLQGVEDVCLLVSQGNRLYAIDDGQTLYDYFLGEQEALVDLPAHNEAIAYYSTLKERLKTAELIHTEEEGGRTFHVFVPFVPKGEFAGALYMKNTPNFSFITREIVSSYNESSLIFSGLIFFGFLTLFLISTYTMHERDQARELLFKEREQQLAERIAYQKEALFTKRIYHTHHKAEKVMGFIKEDLRALCADNSDAVGNRVIRYANFVSRVIYDMKWFDPPLQTIRNPLFRTDLNEVIRFLVENICQRVARHSEQYRFELDMDAGMPPVQINEYVVWEILEPLLQNSMDHNADTQVTIRIQTRYHPRKQLSTIEIADNGKGLAPDLLEKSETGIKRIFLENITTKTDDGNSGYGCYLAYEIARQRCGWSLDAENLMSGGCRFILTIPHYGQQREATVC